MRHKITGKCLAANERGEALVSKGKYGAAGRRAWCKQPKKSKPEIHPFKERRALRGNPAPFFKQRRTLPHLLSRIERAHRALDPLWGFSNFSEVLDAFATTHCHITETKDEWWVFQGTTGRVSVSVVTRPLCMIPTAGNGIAISMLPVEEIYLTHGPELLACGADTGVVRLNNCESR